MTKTQEELLYILKTFNDICKRHDIEYFLTGGSALGAIRHNGFIPWDDDIDFGVTRSTWQKLRPILLEELPENMELVDRISHPTYGNHIPRIVDNNTTRIRRANLTDGCPQGQFLEVFIHDAVPKEKLAEQKRSFLLYCELLSPYLTLLLEKYHFKGGLKDDEFEILKEFPLIREEAEKRGKEAVLDELEKSFSSYSYEQSDYLLLDWGTNTAYYPIDSFEEIRYEKFEDIVVPVPKRACDNLRIDYGNKWTNLPPIDQRRTHYALIDNDVSWTEYMDLISQRISPDKTREMRLSKKEIQLKELAERIPKDKILLDIKMRSAQAQDMQTGDLRELWDRGEYRIITDKYDGYINLKKRTRAYTISRDIREESKTVIAASLIMQDRMDDAERILDIERNARLSATDTELVSDIKRLREAKTLYYDRLYDEAEEMLKGVTADMKRSLPYRMSAARLAMLRGDNTPDAELLHKEHPDDLEIAKIYADSLVIKGDKAEAERIYDIIIENSDNGMDVLDIVKKREGRE